MAKKNSYSTLVNAPSLQTEQTSPEQVKNSAGGYVYQAGDWDRLARFLLLGSSEGSFYFSPQKLSKENFALLQRCIAEDGRRVVGEIAKARLGNRALKTDPLIFALASCVRFGSPEVKKLALRGLTGVCRTGTQLFQFVAECEGLGVGWGRTFKAGIRSWYTDKDAESVAFQVVKYRQRDGWSHRDLLRLAHVKPDPQSPGRSAVLAWVAGKTGEGDALPSGLIGAYEHAVASGDPATCADLVRQHGLTWEMLPSTVLNSPDVWAALLDKMGLTALVRNLGKMTSLGVFDSAVPFKRAISKLSDPVFVEKGAVHPLALYNALKVYTSGKGVKGSLKWQPKSAVIDALDKAVETSFGTLPKIGKRVRIAVDCSGSMAPCTVCNGNMSLFEAAAVMSKAFLHQADCDVMVWADKYQWVPASSRQRVDDLARTYNKFSGGTAMGLAFAEPERHADVVVVFTDNETWDGVRCEEAWQAFKKVNPGAKCVVLSMVANGYAAMPPDPDVLQCVGFDTSAPNVVAAFCGFGEGQEEGDED